MSRVLLVQSAGADPLPAVTSLEEAGFEVQTESDAQRVERACVSADIVLLQVPPKAEGCGPALDIIRKSIGMRDVPVIALGPDGEGARPKPENLPHVRASIGIPIDDGILLDRIRDAIRPAGKRMRVDVRVLNAFIQGIVETIPALTGTPLRRKGVHLRTNHRLPGDVSGAITISGILNGSAAICFPEEFARAAVSTMLQAKPEEVAPDDVRGGVGEIANIVIGRAKTLLANQRLTFGLSAPVVVSGPGHELDHPEGAPCVSVHFEGDGKELAFLISYRETGTGME
ncbi:MAG: chemotaxis protein CheX [Planctomycetes bacterium]|nr:chemotaxis protein CheX [Planctomycetota bacterium]